MMSTIVWGKFVLTDFDAFSKNQSFGFNMVKTCATDLFAIDFKNKMGIPRDEWNTSNEILFTLTDNFFMSTCDRFMEPIYYPIGQPSTEASLNTDLMKVKKLFTTAFKYSFVDKIKLFISYGEADIDEYESLITDLDGFIPLIVDKYNHENWVPTIMLTIHQKISRTQGNDGAKIEKGEKKTPGAVLCVDKN